MNRKIIYYITGFLFLIFLWWIGSLLLNEFIVPNPFIVFKAIGVDWGTHKENLLYTSWIALVGILLSLINSIISLIIMTLHPKLEQLIYPTLVMLKATPAVALAPLIIAINGTDISSKFLIASLISFFPMIIGGLDGIKRTPQSILMLGNTYNATKINKLRHVQYGYFIDGLLSGLKTSAPLSIVGAIVSEYIIGGGSYGLGTFIIANVYSSVPINIFSGALLSTLLGLSFFFTASLLFNIYEKRLQINSQFI